MKTIHIYITVLLLSLPILGQAQTYIQGEDFLPFSQAATSKYLNPKTQISLEEAFIKLQEIEGDEFKKTLSQLRGEYYMVDSMMISFSCSELSTLRKLKYRGIHYSYEYIKYGFDTAEYWHIMYKDLDTHKTLVYYSRKSQVLFFDLENDTYSIMGTVYAPEGKISEAQEFIDKLVESISFK
ncbi:hypothetical protein [Sphingobacterium yanglingense]|uniref:Uncharacterized protein n=1 Tax=Sphingobacterium yanglingense TaxID=1437280 RepID=A0A4R6WL80_9SPHI|nr:hypothetical protein [Sphingobacterium yanglingense]TDQ79065.1 hypothetical protein CLV99_0497 [Sphingobacterium yanglingense]